MRKHAKVLMLLRARAGASSLAGCAAAFARAVSSPAQACCASCQQTVTTTLHEPLPSWPVTYTRGSDGAFLEVSDQTVWARPPGDFGQRLAQDQAQAAWGQPIQAQHGQPQGHALGIPASLVSMAGTPAQHATWHTTGQHGSFAAPGARLRSSAAQDARLGYSEAHVAWLGHAEARRARSAVVPGIRHFSTFGVQEQALQQGVDACTTVLAASVSEDGAAAAAGVGSTAPRPPGLLGLLQEAALGVQWVNDATGLPWWASIPLTTLAVRTALIPFSMWQARTVRTTYQVYREAVELTDKQLGAIKEELSPLNAMEQASRVRRGKLLLSNFGLLRTKIKAPHPAWILINPLVQMPVFVLLGGSLRLMAGVQWPGLTTGGALWFQDLTQVHGSLTRHRCMP